MNTNEWNKRRKQNKSYQVNGGLKTDKTTINDDHTDTENTHTQTCMQTHAVTWAGCGERWSLSSCSDRCQWAPPAPSAASSSEHWSESSPPPPPPAASSAASGGPLIYPAGGGGRCDMQRSGWDTWGRRKEGNKKRREGDRCIKREISLGAGGLTGSGVRLNLADYQRWCFGRRVSVSAVFEGFIFQSGIRSTFPMNTQMPCGIRIMLDWAE